MDMNNSISRDSVGRFRIQIDRDTLPQDQITILNAAHSFGFLLNRGETLPLPSFAERIANNYDAKHNPKISAVVKALTPITFAH
jgi:hypothetical protein